MNSQQRAPGNRDIADRGTRLISKDLVDEGGKDEAPGSPSRASQSTVKFSTTYEVPISKGSSVGIATTGRCTTL